MQPLVFYSAQMPLLALLPHVWWYKQEETVHKSTYLYKAVAPGWKVRQHFFQSEGEAG